jgi:hypothetical protein
MSSIPTLADRIRAYCQSTGVSLGSLGRRAVNDSRICHDIVAGNRSPTIRTADKLVAWMEANPDARPQRRRQPKEGTNAAA